MLAKLIISWDTGFLASSVLLIDPHAASNSHIFPPILSSRTPLFPKFNLPLHVPPLQGSFRCNLLYLNEQTTHGLPPFQSKTYRIRCLATPCPLSVYRRCATGSQKTSPANKIWNTGFPGVHVHNTPGVHNIFYMLTTVGHNLIVAHNVRVGGGLGMQDLVEAAENSKQQR